MGFRERPEYQQWRDQVINLFGRRCILCGHEGNIHAHHVRPVHTFPEVALEPKNGVPLCGNCHTEVNARELDYIVELERRQQLVLAGESTTSLLASDAMNEEYLKQQAKAEPTNTKVVEKWFEEASDSAEVIGFYNEHHTAFRKTATLYAYLAYHLAKVQRWSDVIRVADGAVQCMEGNDIYAGADGSLVDMIIFRKVEALVKLGRETEAIAYLREMIAHYPENARTYYRLSSRLSSRLDLSSPDKELLAECRSYASRAATIRPDEYQYASWAAFLAMIAGDYVDALRYAERALTLSTNDDEKVDALAAIADIYVRNKLYRDAREYLRQALQVDERNIRIISDMAHCYYMEDNTTEALRMARHGLMLDPNDKGCQQILQYCEKK